MFHLLFTSLLVNTVSYGLHFLFAFIMTIRVNCPLDKLSSYTHFPNWICVVLWLIKKNMRK